MSNPRRRKKASRKDGEEEPQKWPFVRFSERDNAWKVDARTKHGGQRRFFTTKAAAEGFAAQCRVKKANDGTAAFDDRELAAFGWKIADAVRYALAHLREQAASKPVADAVKDLLAFKTNRVSEDRLSDIRNRLKKFSDAFPERTVAQVSPEDVLGFLARIEHPTTRNDYRKEIVMLWHFCRAKKWVPEALSKTSVPRDVEPEKARTILSVEETTRLMKASVDPDIRALNALVLFGGLRREEVEKLDWSAVNFRTGHIEVSAVVSKVARERFAPMPKNLRAWLLPLAKDRAAANASAATNTENGTASESKKKKQLAATGPIVSRVLMHALRATWKAAKLHPWPQDAHRHSFISYRRRIIGDSQTAQDAGTSEAIIKRHYKRPVTAADAKRYFEIAPPAEARS